MPFIELKTNIKLNENDKEKLSKELGKEIELLHKSENWLMLNFIDNQSMYFKGSNKPCVIAEVKLYGDASGNDADKFTATLTNTIQSITNIDKDRIYVNYFGTDKWGYSGFNF